MNPRGEMGPFPFTDAQMEAAAEYRLRLKELKAAERLFQAAQQVFTRAATAWNDALTQGDT